jgi:hypothetical protein
VCFARSNKENPGIICFSVVSLPNSARIFKVFNGILQGQSYPESHMLMIGSKVHAFWRSSLVLPGTYGEKEMSKFLKGLFHLLIGGRSGSRVICFSINSELERPWSKLSLIGC